MIQKAATVVEAALSAFGGIDILVNNAGAFPMKPWLEATAAEWNNLYNANVGSVVRLVTGLVPAMQERGWGRVIMIGSFLGPMPQPFVANHGATKMVNIEQAVALVSVAAALGLDGSTIKDVRIALGGVAHKPWRA